MIMARVRIKIGDNEIEIDSRDFYIDNDTIHEVIDKLTKCMPEPKAPLVYAQQNSLKQTLDVFDDSNVNENDIKSESAQSSVHLNACLENIQEAEAYEPEFADDCSNDNCVDTPVHSHLQIKEGLQALRDTNGFFDSPRTKSDITQKLQNDGWLTNSRIVSAVLAEMVDCKEITKNSPKDKQSSMITYVSPMFCLDNVCDNDTITTESFVTTV